jgi:hypothetical protein
MGIIERFKGLFTRGAGCARLCEQIHAEGPERTQCVRDGATHAPGNLCDACGNDPSRLCVSPSDHHFCCKSGEMCDRDLARCVPRSPTR